MISSSAFGQCPEGSPHQLSHTCAFGCQICNGITRGSGLLCGPAEPLKTLHDLFTPRFVHRTGVRSFQLRVLQGEQACLVLEFQHQLLSAFVADPGHSAQSTQVACENRSFQVAR